MLVAVVEQGLSTTGAPVVPVVPVVSVAPVEATRGPILVPMTVFKRPCVLWWKIQTGQQGS